MPFSIVQVQSGKIALCDEGGNYIAVLDDGGTRRLQVSGKFLNASGTPINPATEDTLLLIKNTDGIKKITDALPTGDNSIGRVKITDDTNVAGVDAANALYVAGKSAVGVVPSSNPVTVSGIDGGGLKRTFLLDATGIIQSNVAQWIGSTAPTVGQKAMAASIPVVLPTDQTVKVVFATPGGGLALPKMVDIVFNKAEGTIVSSVYKRVQTYIVPVGYSGYLIKFSSYQAEAASSRCVAETNMGSLSIVTNVWTSGTQYTDPQWAGVVQADVTTTLSAGAGNVVVTVGYTNESGTAGRTGTITIPRGSVVGSRWDIVLQGTDLGIRSIQTVSVTPTLAAGVINILGLLQLAVHQDQSTTTQTETSFSPGAITFPAGTVIGIEYAGGTVSKQRFFDTLIQLVASI